MNESNHASEGDNLTILILGIASFFLFPITAIPGIMIGRKKTNFSAAGRTGYAFCWICLALFIIQVIVVTLIFLA
jgi:cellulose synthase/poly-beta-1,6-N-acetylglucosamine synthase-like glycosyltransferase